MSTIISNSADDNTLTGYNKPTDDSSAATVAVITGPTATGKTKLGVLLARDLDGEVISADSMQVYRGMDIGTAKPTKQEMGGIIHHMIDVAEPTESYSVARYIQDASDCISAVLSRGRLPIIVGGTGLYIDSLVSGRYFGEDARDDKLRTELNLRYDMIGGDAMHRELAAVDPDRAAKLHPADKKRLIRALEVYILTGKTITAHDAETKLLPPRYNAVTIALTYRDRTDLYARIDARVDDMLRLGLVDEVSGLLESGLTKNHTSMQAIGYKEIAAALNGTLSIGEAADAVRQESRRYAKRQLTWLRRRKDIFWIEHEREPDFETVHYLSTNYLHVCR